MQRTRLFASAIRALVAAAVAGLPAAVGAAPCDCARRVGLCQAEVGVEANRVTVDTPNPAECTEVSYAIDDEVNAIAFRGGRETIAYGAPKPVSPSSVTVKACFICDEKGSRGSSAGRGYGAKP